MNNIRSIFVSSILTAVVVVALLLNFMDNRFRSMIKSKALLFNGQKYELRPVLSWESDR